MKSSIQWIIACLGLLVAAQSFFIIEEGQRGIVLRFGRAARNEDGQVALCTPGLYWKVPGIDQVHRLDARIQSMENQADRFVTAEKKDVIVDSYVKWRISDFGRFYLATQGGQKRFAQHLLRQKISDRLRSEIGSRTIKDIVSGSRGELMEGTRQAMSGDSDTSVELGIEIIDIRVKQINLPPEVSHSIYERMRAERTAVAREHRAQGKEQSELIRADVDRRVAIQIAEAKYRAAVLHGEGDAEAAKVFAEALQDNKEFYLFLRSLEAYRRSFTPQDVLVLSPRRASGSVATGFWQFWEPIRLEKT